MYECYFDGASLGNPGKAGIGIVVKKDGETVEKISESVGIATNNVAEYSALIRLLEYLIENNIEGAKIYGDSQLVVNQASGAWKVRQPHLVEFAQKAQELLHKTGSIVSWIPREKNAEADKLSKEGAQKMAPQEAGLEEAFWNFVDSSESLAGLFMEAVKKDEKAAAYLLEKTSLSADVILEAAQQAMSENNLDLAEKLLKAAKRPSKGKSL